MSSRRAWIVVAVTVFGCSDDEENNTGAAQTSASTAAVTTAASTSSTGGSGGAATSSSTGGMGMGPGTLTINASGLTNEEGWLMVASVIENMMPLARACDTVSGGSASAVASEVVPQMDVCQLGDPVVFDEGTYQIRAGLYEPNCQAPCAPTLCLQTDVTVAGNTIFTLPAFQMCVGGN